MKVPTFYDHWKSKPPWCLNLYGHSFPTLNFLFLKNACPNFFRVDAFIFKASMWYFLSLLHFLYFPRSQQCANINQSETYDTNICLKTKITVGSSEAAGRAELIYLTYCFNFSGLRVPSSTLLTTGAKRLGTCILRILKQLNPGKKTQVRSIWRIKTTSRLGKRSSCIWKFVKHWNNLRRLGVLPIVWFFSSVKSYFRILIYEMTKI